MAYPIIPIFAFANAGVVINGEPVTDVLASIVTGGIIVGLFVGEQLGIFLAAYVMKLLGLSTFPEIKGTWKVVYRADLPEW